MKLEITKKYNNNFHSCLGKIADPQFGFGYAINIDDGEYNFPNNFLEIIMEVSNATGLGCSLSDLLCHPETGFHDFGQFMLMLDTEDEGEALKFAKIFFKKMVEYSI